MSNYILSPARPDDAEKIAHLFAASWQSPFSQLQFGEMDTGSLATAMVPRIVDSMSMPENEYVVMRTEKGDIAAVAHWTIPVQGAKGTREETAEDKAERLALWDEGYRSRLPGGSNKDLIMEFTIGLRELRERVLEGREHFLLENIATHSDHRGKGLASQLIKWAFTQADQQGALIYLDTASDNPAMNLYKKLGFEEEGSNTIEDLAKYGAKAQENHIHVALLRLPYSK